MSGLSEQQRDIIEQNRRRALEKRRKALTAHNHTLPVRKHVPAVSASCQGRGRATNLPISNHYNRGAPAAPAMPSASQKRFYGGADKMTITFSLESAERFVVECGYDTEVLRRLKSVGSRRYEPTSKLWSFSLADHDTLLTLLRAAGPHINVEPLPSLVLRCTRAPAVTADNCSARVDLAAGGRLEPTLLHALMPFQRTAVEVAVARGGRILLADDMGLGKTLQALAVISYFDDWPLLVVCPSSVRHHWRETMLRYLPGRCQADDVLVLESARDSLTQTAATAAVVATYDLLVRCGGRAARAGFRALIVDESHCLKNGKSARTRAVLALTSGVRRCVLISGTPALSRPVELYWQVAALRGTFAPSFTEFGRRYCAGHRAVWGWDFSGASHMAELHVLLTRHVMVRRLKASVISQLPAKRRTVVVLGTAPAAAVSQCGEQTEGRRRFERLMRDGRGGGGGGSARAGGGMEKRGALLQFFRETAAVKTPAVLDYIDRLLEPSSPTPSSSSPPSSRSQLEDESSPHETHNKFICFGHHQCMLDAVCARLDARAVRYVRIDGATDAAVRHEACQLFQSSDAVRVAVLSLTAAGAGITLTAAALLVFVELFWNPGVLTQAEDRAHRIGQQRAVEVRYLVMKNTADDHIWPLVQRKLDVLNEAGLSKDTFSAADQQHINLSDPLSSSSSRSASQPSITDWLQQEFADDDEEIDWDAAMTTSDHVATAAAVGGDVVEESGRSENDSNAALLDCDEDDSAGWLKDLEHVDEEKDSLCADVLGAMAGDDSGAKLTTNCDDTGHFKRRRV